MTLTDLLYQGLELARRGLDLLARPGPIYLLVRRSEMAVEFQVTGMLPPANPGDGVVSRELTVTVNAVPSVALLPFGTAQHDLWAKEGDVVSMTLVDIDQAGNRSQPSASASIVVSDTIPPGTPGVIGVSITAQREETVPTP